MGKISFKNTPLIIVIILIGIIVFYFYDKNDSFAKKERCAIIGNAYLKEELRDRNYTDGSAISYTGNPQFAYSRKYNSCFYLNSSNFASGIEIAKTEYYIINLTTNEKVASYIRWDKGNDDYLSNPVYIENKLNFDKLEKELFRN